MVNANCDKKCTVFGKCGGCVFLDVPYETQLAAKRKTVVDIFANLIPEDKVASVLGMSEPYDYRDKIVIPFVPSKSKNPRIISGMYKRGTHEVVECDKCLLENPIGQKVARAIKSIMKKHDIAPYDEDSGRGFLRHALVRVGHETDEVLVVLVTNTDEFPNAKAFCRELVKHVPEITSIVQNVNKRQTNVILGEKERVLYGPGFILDRLMGLSFRISSSSFYQINRQMTAALYGLAIDLADLGPNDIVFDAYCGTGTIGLAALKSGAKALVGVDDSASSINDARLNAKHNGAESAEFFCADATEFMLGYDGPHPNVVFLDPPRSGSTPEFLKGVAKLAPERVVYISCNPITQARDAEVLKTLGYELSSVHPVDMFPHTQHIETVALFEGLKDR